MTKMKSKPVQSKRVKYDVTFKDKEGNVTTESVFLFYKDQNEKAGKELAQKYRGQGRKIKILDVTSAE